VLIVPAFAPNLVTLAGSLVLFGIVHGALNIAMNANAVEVERAWQRPLMSSFHAVYSIGGFIGAALGGLYAHANHGPVATFTTVTAIVVVVVGFNALARWPYAIDPAPTSANPTNVNPTLTPTPASNDSLRRSILFLGVLAFCCLVGEGAAADWSAVYLRDNLGSSPGFAANAYAAFAIAMTAGRLVGDRLTAALGPVRLVRGCGILASVGLAIALLISTPVAGVIGFGCLGAGLSCIVPQVFSTAGTRDPSHAGQAIARVASLGFIGFIVGPILIGGLAELVGLPWALSIPVVLVLAVALAAPALRPPAAIPNPSAPDSSVPASSAPGSSAPDPSAPASLGG
jgi:fucose permease